MNQNLNSNFLTLARNSNDGIIILSDDNKIIFANKSMSKLSGYSNEEIINQPIFKFIPNDQRSRIQHKIKARINKKTISKTYQSSFFNNKGKKIDVIVTASLISMHGKPASLAIIRNISEKLDTKSSNFKNVIKQTGVGICITDKDENFTFANNTAHKIFGVKNNTLIGQNLRAFTSDKEFNKILKYSKSRELGKSESYEIEIIRPSGEKLNLLLTASPDFDIHGKHVGSLGIYNNISSSKQYKQNLEREKNQLTSICDNIDENIYISNPTTYQILFANKHLKKFLGKDPTGQFCYKALYNFSGPCHFCNNKEISLKNKPLKGKYHSPITKKDYATFNRLIKWPNNQNVRFNMSTDITKRKDKTLSESTNYKYLINSAPIGILTVNKKGNILETNPALIKMLGSPSAEETKKINVLNFQPLINTGFTKNFNNCIKTGKHNVFEAPYTTKWGKYLYLRYHLSPIKDENKTIVGAQAIIENINDHILAINELQQSKEEYKVLVENANSGIIIAQDNMLKFANKQASKISGYSQKKLLSTPFIELIHPKDKNFVQKMSTKIINSKKKGNTYDFRIIDSKNRVKWLKNNTVTIIWNNKPAILSFFNDITKQKENEDTTKRQLELQHTISKISSRFVGTHDLDSAINKSLQDIGIISNACRTSLFLIKKNKTHFSNSHEWSAKNISPEIKNLQNLPLNLFPWWMEKINNNEIIHITDTSTLPKEAVYEKKILEKKNIKSLLIFPLSIYGEVAGFIGLDNVEKTKNWHQSDVKFLKMISEIFGTALERKKSEEKEKEALFKILELYKHLGIINRKISVLQNLHKQKPSKKAENTATFITTSGINISQADICLLFKFNNKKKIFNLISSSKELSSKQKKDINTIKYNSIACLKKISQKKKRIQGSTKQNVLNVLNIDNTIKGFLLFPIVDQDNNLTNILFFGFKNKPHFSTQELTFYDLFIIYATSAIKAAQT